MSDTPRTDALRDSSDHPTPRGELWQLACDLERELAAARAELEQANETFSKWAENWATCADARLALQKERDTARAQLERTMKVVEAAREWYVSDGNHWEDLHNALEEWEAGR